MGGPWVTPEKACRWVLQSETTLEGPMKFHGALPLPEVNDGYHDDSHFGVRRQLQVPMEDADYRDTSVVAYRVPDGAPGSIKNERPDIWAKSARIDGSVWVPADQVMSDPRQSWKKSPDDVPIPPDDAIDLTEKLAADGVLEWECFHSSSNAWYQKRPSGSEPT